MTDRAAPPVSLEPQQSIVFWSIREFQFDDDELKTHHLIGYLPTKQTMRVTSPIASFSLSASQIITSSGRIYKLTGQPVINDDIETVLKIYMKNNHIVSERDVTHEYLRVH